MLKRTGLILAILLIITACSQGQEEIQPDIVVDSEAPPAPTTTVEDIPEPSLVPTQEPTNAPQPTFSPETITIPADDPIQIAYLLWDANPVGMDQVRAVELAIADFGAEILGHPITLIRQNSECNEFAGQQGALKLMQDQNILGVIGTTCSIPALKAAEVISENDRVLIMRTTS